MDGNQQSGIRCQSDRAELRQQVLASPLFDAPRFARNFVDALWGMWQRYESQP
jgi:protein O-GlcNAc transferase